MLTAGLQNTTFNQLILKIISKINNKHKKSAVNMGEGGILRRNRQLAVIGWSWAMNYHQTKARMPNFNKKLNI